MGFRLGAGIKAKKRAPEKPVLPVRGPFLRRVLPPEVVQVVGGDVAEASLVADDRPAVLDIVDLDDVAAVHGADDGVVRAVARADVQRAAVDGVQVVEVRAVLIVAGPGVAGAGLAGGAGARGADVLPDVGLVGVVAPGRGRGARRRGARGGAAEAVPVVVAVIPVGAAAGARVVVAVEPTSRDTVFFWLLPSLSV